MDLIGGMYTSDPAQELKHLTALRDLARAELLDAQEAVAQEEEPTRA